MSDLSKRAREYLAMNAAESGADALIAEMADEIVMLQAQMATYLGTVKQIARVREDTIASLRAKLESARKALDLYADESNWHFNGRFDPNSSRFNGVRTAQDALTDETGKQ